MIFSILPDDDTIRLFKDDADVDDEGWVPSEDQAEALRKLLERLAKPGVYALTGAAGAGKTTLMRALLRRLIDPVWEVVLVAPTWKAAARLAEVTGRPAKSLHSLIYTNPKQERFCKGCMRWDMGIIPLQDVAHVVQGEGPPVPLKTLPALPGEVQMPVKAEVLRRRKTAWRRGKLRVVPLQVRGVPKGATRVMLKAHKCGKCEKVYAPSEVIKLQQRLAFTNVMVTSGAKHARLVVVDEASMLSQKQVKDAERALLGNGRTRILLLGDKNQLSPVLSAEEKAAERPGEGPLDNPDCVLDRIHRQAAESAILPLAHRYKTYPEMSDATSHVPYGSGGDVEVPARPSIEEVADWLIRLRNGRQDAVLIAWTNKDRALLNRLVRERAGWAAWAKQNNTFICNGERLLARAGGPVFNGEVWYAAKCEQIPPGTALMGSDSRIAGHPDYPDVLNAVRLYRLQIVRDSKGSDPRSVILVLPVERNLPRMESDMICEGANPADAKDAMREVATAWRREYDRGVERLQGEYETAVAAAERKDTHGRIFRAAVAKGDGELAKRAVSVMVASMVEWKRKPALAKIEAALQNLSLTNDEVVNLVLDAVSEPEDAALDCVNVQDYAVNVKGALRTSEIAVFDWGECLTGHAMQGSQASHVGVMFSWSFGKVFWEKERVEAMRWVYTAYTRAISRLVIFDVRGRY